MIPFVAMLGLNEWAIRLPNGLVGILTVWVLYQLVMSLFQDRRLAFAAALFLAISPWHIHFSRWSVRAILLPLFFCGGLYLFLIGLKQPWKLVLSGLVFGLSLHTYNSARVFVPLFLLGLTWFYRQSLWRQRTYALIAAGTFSVILGALFSFWISPEGMIRARRALASDFVSVVSAYIAYFSPNFLFSNGDPNLRHSVPNMGQLYHFEILTVGLGF